VDADDDDGGVYYVRDGSYAEEGGVYQVVRREKREVEIM